MPTSRYLLAALAALALPATASAADPFTATEIKVQAVVGPNDDTTCTVDATLYKPAGASAEHPVAAVISTNGFGGSKNDPGIVNLAGSYAKRGYGFLAYSGLGFGASSCKITLDDPDWDGKAASAMIDYLGGGRADTAGHSVDWVIRDTDNHARGQSAHDPRVGMIGGSYGGQVQFAAAGMDPRLDTIVPQITWNDLVYSLAPNNTAFKFGVTSEEPGTEKYQWTTLFFGLGVSGTGPDTFGQCPNYSDSVCSTKAFMDASGYPNAEGMALSRHASVTSYMSRIKIPTFLAQGQNDTLFNLNEAVATYEALRKQGTPVKMLWRFNGHSGSQVGASEDNPANPEAAYASRAYLEWFDFYLRGVGEPPVLDFSYYRDWVKYPAGKDADPSVSTVPSYPAAPDQSWFLSSDANLVSSAGAVKADTPSFQFAPGGTTSFSENSGPGNAANQDPTDAPGTFAAFTSAALTKDTDVVGIPKVTVSLDAQPQSSTQGGDPGARLVLFAKLYEITADGKTVLPNRLIAPVRIPDVTKPVTITLPGIAHRFAKGSKFQFVLAASDAAYKNNNTPGRVTVNVDPKKPSELTIPVLGEPAPAPVAAPAGSQNPGAGQLPQVKQEAKQTQAASLTKPSKSCRKNRRVVTIHFTGVKRPDRIVSRKVTVNGKRVKVRRKARILKISLKKRKAGTYRIFVLVRSKQGKVRRTARTYKVC